MGVHCTTEQVILWLYSRIWFEFDGQMAIYAYKNEMKKPSKMFARLLK